MTEAIVILPKEFFCVCQHCAIMIHLIDVLICFTFLFIILFNELLWILCRSLTALLSLPTFDPELVLSTPASPFSITSQLLCTESSEGRRELLLLKNGTRG